MQKQDSVDDALYSRQRYMLGDEAMHSISKSRVFLSGLGGVGIEIAKNVALAGVKSLTLHDTKPATYSDLGSNFFLEEEDVLMQKNRAEKCERRVAELNPYVSVQTDMRDIEENNLAFLTDYQCVVLTDASLSLQCKVDNFCRTQNPPIQFISCNIFGVFAYLFCDFGPDFKVMDTWTEEPKAFFIGNISKANPGVVTTLDYKFHGLEKGNTVLFKEIVGMYSLNDTVQTVTEVLSPYAFTICDTSGPEFQSYMYGGVGCLQKPPSFNLTFESLEDQLEKPDLVIADFSKLSLYEELHVGMQALDLFQEKFGRLPDIRSPNDATELVQIASTLNSSLSIKNWHTIRSLSYVSQGYFAPLSASMGGVAAQEVLKALTGKFKPLKQWLYLDTVEILKQQRDLADSSSFTPRSDRYDSLRICIGEDLINKLHNSKLFMVGCGAIGCEFLKNFALLGVSSGINGQLTITDNDVIEKSNLNRQFLFRSRDIQKPKSSTAAESAKEINPKVQIKPILCKVSPETESIFSNEFFESQDLVVNALDNIEARRYVDSRCVQSKIGLLETGTMGAKGHVQIIVPHLTENYASQRDPEDEEVPFCTLKSFPSVIEHTIQWARDKFESLFVQKVEFFNKFWAQDKTLENVIKNIDSLDDTEGLVIVTKMLKNRPTSWSNCVAFARNKFEKYFNHKAKHLLLAFPQDTKLSDGSPFWKSPKRPPTPQEFDINDELHLMFLVSASRLFADIHLIHYSQEDLSAGELTKIVQYANTTPFVTSKKEKWTKEEKPTTTAVKSDDRDLEKLKNELKRLCSSYSTLSEISKVKPLSFEKDDDDNGHIDFITASANLRARMYNIELVDRLKVKKIAGKIIPAIATTTAAVAGLPKDTGIEERRECLSTRRRTEVTKIATIELVKFVMKSSLTDYRNCFMNLALPYIIFSEPGPAKMIHIKESLTYSVWDHWTIRGNMHYTLRDFINYFKDCYGLEVTMVVQGVRLIFIPIMPGHMKRLDLRMTDLIRASPSQKYISLTVSFASTLDKDDDVAGPPIRYFL